MPKSDNIYALRSKWIDFDLNSMPPVQEGRLYWNSDDGTLEIGMPGGNVNLQIGQEQLVRVTNKTGIDLSNGQIVYVNGAQGSRPTVQLANADIDASSKAIIGILTENIANNNNGYITTFGLVRDVKTDTDSDGNALTAGDVLYLSPFTNGGYTNVEPTMPNNRIKIGYVLFANATEGIIFFNIDSLYNCDDIQANQLLGATWTNQCHWNNLFSSTGRATGGTISESGGVITIAAGTGFIKANDSDTDTLYSFDWAEETGFTVDLNTIKYFGIEYNSGSPQVMETTSEADFDLDTSFPLGQVINQAGEYYVLNNPWWVTDGITNIIERFGSFGHLQRDDEVGGLIPGYSGVRYLTMSGGRIWGRLTEYNIANFTTVGDVADFDMYYRDSATTWAEVELYQWNNTQYNPITGVNAYTLQSIPNNQYSVIWIWVNASSQKPSLIFPHQTYPSAASAEAEGIPDFPAMWYKGGLIIGRFICKEGVDDPIEVQSIFDNTFIAALAADHGNLSGLADDDHTQYELTNDRMTTKGDLTVHNGTNVNRFPVGTDGYALLADSGETEGLKWGEVSLSGLTENEILFGKADGTVDQSSDLKFDGNRLINLKGYAGAMVTTTSTSYSITSLMQTVLGNATANANFSLPAAATASNNIITVKNITDFYNITLSASGADTLEGITTGLIIYPGESLTVHSDGTSDWRII